MRPKLGRMLIFSWWTMGLIVWILQFHYNSIIIAVGSLHYFYHNIARDGMRDESMQGMLVIIWE